MLCLYAKRLANGWWMVYDNYDRIGLGTTRMEATANYENR